MVSKRNPNKTIVSAAKHLTNPADETQDLPNPPLHRRVTLQVGEWAGGVRAKRIEYTVRFEYRHTKSNPRTGHGPMCLVGRNPHVWKH